MVRYEVNNYPEGMTLELCTPEEIDEHIARLMEQLNNTEREARRKAAEALADYVAGNYIPEEADPHPAAILVEGLRERDRDARLGSAMSLARMGASRAWPIRLVMPAEEAERVIGPCKTRLAKLCDITRVRVESVAIAAGECMFQISGGPLERRMKVVWRAIEDSCPRSCSAPGSASSFSSPEPFHGETSFLVPCEQFHFVMNESDLQVIAEQTSTEIFLDDNEVLLGTGDPVKYYQVACVGDWKKRCAAIHQVHERLEPDPLGQGPIVAHYASFALAQALSHRDRDFRIEAARALAVLGPAAAEVSSEALAAQLADVEGTIRSECLKTLACLGEAAADGAAHAVGLQLVHQDPDVRRMAALTLGEMGPAAAPAAAPLLARAIRPLTERDAAAPHEGPHREIRILAVEALLAMGEAAAADAAEALARILRADPCEDMLRYAALRALGHMGAGAAPQVRRIACAMQEDPVDFVRQAAAETLVDIGCPDALNGAMAIGEATDLIARAPQVVAAAKAEAEARAKCQAEADARAERQKTWEAAIANEETETFDLVFDDLEFAAIDVEAFRESLPVAFQELGVNEEFLQKVRLSLPKSSNMVEVAGPASVIKSLRELPLATIKVLGFEGHVAGEPKQKVEKKGLGRKAGARKTQAKASAAATTIAEAAPKEMPAETAAEAEKIAPADAHPKADGPQGTTQEAAELGDAVAPVAPVAPVEPVEPQTFAPSSPRDQRIFQSRRRAFDATQNPLGH